VLPCLGHDVLPVQDMASRGLSVVYRLGGEETRAKLLKSLMGTLQGDYWLLICWYFPLDRTLNLNTKALQVSDGHRARFPAASLAFHLTENSWLSALSGS
jgi:hypothetical protein